MRTHLDSRGRMASWIALVGLGTFAALGPRIHPAIAIGAPLRIDILALMLLAVPAILSGAGRAGARAGGRVVGTGASEGLSVVPLAAAGGLLGAAFVSPWAAFPWLAVPALALAWVGSGSGRIGGLGERRAGRPVTRHGPGLAVALLAGVANCTLLATASSSGLRISPEEFAAMDFRVNSLLADVPLHDVWAVKLNGHPSPTLKDLGDALDGGSPFQATPALMGLSIVRAAVGFALGWDDPRWTDVSGSFLHRLAEEDRRRSTSEPGTTLGIWRVLYACPEEGVAETINGTVHVAVAASIGGGPEGPRLFLSFRVREVNWTTPFYMRVIDPARRFFVYPSLLRQFAHTWERAGGKAAEEILTGEEL